MTTNIVEQMLVELGLDASKYTAQADKAVKTNKQLEKSLTDTEKASKETEKAQKKLGEETEKAANRFNLFETTLLRATGLEKWVNDVVDAEDAAKSLAANLGLSQDALTKWQNAAKNAGGDGKGIVGLFEKLNELTVKQQATGKKNAILESLGVDLVDTNGKARDLNKVVFELSENLRKLNRPHAYQVAKQLGMDDGTANLMMQGRNGIQQLMKKPYTEAVKAEDEVAKLIKSVQNGIKIIGKFTAVLLGNTGLLKLANDAAKANMQLTNLSTNLRVNATSLQSWQNAAKTGGGTAEGMTASLTGIKQAMNGLVMFGDASMLPYFNALGVSMVDSYGKVRDMNSVMLDLADAFSKMPRDQAYTLAKQMGLDDGTFNTLVQGRKELQEILDIQKRMYHSDGEAIARSRELTKQQAILSAHWQSMKQLVGDALTPILLTLIKVVNSFFEFLQRHEKVIKAVFQTAAIVIGTLLIPTLLSAGRALLGFVAPFAPAIAAVTALAGAFLLLYDDYDTWAKGGKSLFDWGAFSTAIKGIKISVDTLCTAFGNMVKAVKNNAIPALKSYAEAVGILAHDDYNGSDKQIEQAEQAKQVEQTKKVEQAKQVEQAKKAKQTKQVKQAKQTKKVSGTFSDIVIGAIADATGQKKEDVADFVGESMYKLFHGGKDYFEQNGIQKPVEANSTTRKKTSKDKDRVILDGKGKKEVFIQKYWGAAKRISKELNVPIEAVLAQFALETDWGRKVIPGTNNLGNIKALGGWKGKTVRAYDKREKSNDPYRVYASVEDFADDYIKVVKHRRYKNVIGSKSSNEFFSRLKNAGYATDPNYVNSGVKTANGISKILNTNTQARISQNAEKAQTMAKQSQQLQASNNVVKNDNRRYVNVNIPNMNVNTSSNTVSGNTVAAMKETHNYMFNQLGVSMT